MNKLAKEIHANNIEKGFFEGKKNIGEMLCLVHSEISEALEADRKGRHCEYSMNVVNGLVEDKDFKESFQVYVKDTFADEMTDAIIRLLDLCAFLEIDIDQHVKAKMRYNKLRSFKHGKNY